MQVATLEGGLKSLKVETHVIPQMAITTTFSLTGFIVLRCCRAQFPWFQLRRSAIIWRALWLKHTDDKSLHNEEV